MKYVFSLDLKVDWFKMSNASLVEDEIDEHSTGKWTKRQYLYEFVFGRGGRKRLPKFKFSAKFPIGLHVILQIQIKKFENDCYLMWKIILTENPSRFNVEPLLK